MFRETVTSPNEHSLKDDGVARVLGPERRGRVYTRSRNLALNMLPPVLRDPGDDPPFYGGNSPYFTVEFHHGGNFYAKPNNLVYERRFVLLIDYFQVAWCSKENLMKFLRAVGNDMVLEFYFKKQRMSLGKGLTRLASKRDILCVLKDREGQGLLQIYVVAPRQSYALLLDAHEVDDNQTFEDCYVPIVKENQGAKDGLLGQTNILRTMLKNCGHSTRKA